METLKLLVERGADLNKADPELKYTAMHEAIFSQIYDNVIFLIKSGARVDTETKFGVSMANHVEDDLKKFPPGHKKYKKLMIIKDLLIERGVEFPPKPAPYEFFQNDKLGDKDISLAVAIKEGDIERIRALSEKVDLNKVNKEGMTFLSYALLLDEKEAAAVLTELGATR